MVLMITAFVIVFILGATTQFLYANYTSKVTNKRLYKKPFLDLIKDVENDKIEFVKRIGNEVFFKHIDNNSGVYLMLDKRQVAICSDYLTVVDTMTLVTTSFNKVESDLLFDKLTSKFFDNINIRCRSIDGVIYSNNLINEIMEKKRIVNNNKKNMKKENNNDNSIKFTILFEDEYERMMEESTNPDNTNPSNPLGFSDEDYVDILVAKIRESGVDSLTQEEVTFLSNINVWK